MNQREQYIHKTSFNMTTTLKIVYTKNSNLIIVLISHYTHDNSTAVPRVASTTGKTSSLSPGINAVQPHLRENEAKITLSICSHFRGEHAIQPLAAQHTSSITTGASMNLIISAKKRTPCRFLTIAIVQARVPI